MFQLLLTAVLFGAEQAPQPPQAPPVKACQCDGPLTCTCPGKCDCPQCLAFVSADGPKQAPETRPTLDYAATDKGTPYFIAGKQVGFMWKNGAYQPYENGVFGAPCIAPTEAAPCPACLQSAAGVSGGAFRGSECASCGTGTATVRTRSVTRTSSTGSGGVAGCASCGRTHRK